MTIIDGSDAVVFAVVVLSRLLLPLLIPRDPLPGIVSALVVDAADQTVFPLLSDMD